MKIDRAFGLMLVAAIATMHASAQEWQSTVKSDALTGKSFTQFVLRGKFLTPPAQWDGSSAPSISLRCDPAGHRGRLSGRFIDGFIDANAVIDLTNGKASTVHYRLDDGKVQTAEELEVGTSTDYQALSVTSMFLSNILWGHELPHKPHSSDQVHKFVIAVQQHLGGQIVMQFDMPDAEQVGAACETEYR
ncbi:MAG: hypothetical protein ACLGXA_04565 [Acidobacteriota bacterium]